MGAWTRGKRRVTGRRWPVPAGLAAATVLGLSACDPAGTLNAGVVARTTDRAGTRELERQHVDVRYLNCTGSYDGGDGTAGRASAAGRTPSPSARPVVKVDCRGETADRRAITLTGRVTREVGGRCVRGNLTAWVGGREWFHVDVLGNCDAASPPAYTPPARTSPPPHRPGPEVTVTVTRTVRCAGDPTCGPVRGK